jgi:dihydroxy-acid dehydratase
MLPGGASIPAVHAERLRHAEATGMRAVAMARDGGPSPRKIVTAAAIRNAMVVLAALGGSTNAVIHLAAIAGRVGIKMELEELDHIGRTTPVLVDLKPVGKNYMEDFHAAGGLPALLRQLGPKIDRGAMTAAGDSIQAMLDRWLPFVDEKIIRPQSNPVSPGEALTVVRGNLAPDGAVIKRAAAEAGLMQHKGPALVFEGLEDLARRIDDPALPVTKDHVLVLRNIGPIGAPGMPEAGGIPIPRKLAQAGVKDMVRVSDARMSGTAYGAIVLHVAPEAAIGGPLALVRDGDIIELDVANRSINMLVDAKELERRRAAWKPPARPKRGYHRLYAEHVMQADKGCDFDFLRDEKMM